MPDEAAFNEAMGMFEDMYREEVYVQREGHWLIMEFEGHMLHVNLWSGKTVVETDGGETVYEVGDQY